MTVRDLAIFLIGFLLGGLIVRLLVLHAARRFLRPHLRNEHSIAARRAAMQYLGVHGTLNCAQMSRLMDVPEPVARRHLEQMARDGFIAAQGHRGAERFYTRNRGEAL